MNPDQTSSTETEQALPDSNTLGGTSSTGAGPDGTETTPAPETVGLDLDEVGEVARELEE
ncbi:hypothetical protein [Fibrella aquatilis]|uniref:Uncharacterized protein n=1 Tax=Fibrella aquatilis TaxID=2817059 RepID=A0A939JXL7_9BACT|nr:hypothetical protein [Fibrella aquatilis]MBO0931164.1 hypothetical protein [Fibrella aquatilis]